MATKLLDEKSVLMRPAKLIPLESFNRLIDKGYLVERQIMLAAKGLLSYPDSVDIDQVLLVVSLRALMNCCS